MTVRELTESDFHATFSAPMRRLAADEDAPVQIPLRPYVAEAIEALELPTTLDAIEIHQVSVGHDKRYTHVVFNYGSPNRFLVLVVDNGAATVFGHRLLELAA
jgi:hypothetical protein